MVWSSILPVTIFVLANTVSVSQSAATGRHSLMNIQTEADSAGGEAELPPQSDFNSSPSSSEAESVGPEWINAHPGQDVDEETLDSVPLSPGATTRFRYDDETLGLLEPRERLLLFNRFTLPELVEMPQRVHDGTTPASRQYFRANGFRNLKRLNQAKPIPVQAFSHLREHSPSPVMWPASSNFRIPAENFIRVNAYEKRSPRCIAKCMQQGMVHPLQCHSLC